jgi:hypothetical protein
VGAWSLAEPRAHLSSASIRQEESDVNGQQTWTRTNEEGQSTSIIADPSRTIGDEQVFEITETALADLLTSAGFVRVDDNQ